MLFLPLCQLGNSLLITSKKQVSDLINDLVWFVLIIIRTQPRIACLWAECRGLGPPAPLSGLKPRNSPLWPVMQQPLGRQVGASRTGTINRRALWLTNFNFYPVSRQTRTKLTLSHITIKGHFGQKVGLVVHDAFDRGMMKRFSMIVSGYFHVNTNVG